MGKVIKYSLLCIIVSLLVFSGALIFGNTKSSTTLIKNTSISTQKIIISPSGEMRANGTGICGTVMYLPNNVAQRQGETAHGISKKLHVLDSQKHLVATPISDEKGNYTVSLNPGTYTVETEEYGEYGIKQTVPVENGVCTRVNISIATP